jgi:hypothetical protein
MGNQANALNAYGQAAQGAGQAMAPANTAMADLAAYLGLGQTATQNQQRAAQINNQMPGIGSAIGSLLGLGTGYGSTIGGDLWSGLGSLATGFTGF